MPHHHRTGVIQHPCGKCKEDCAICDGMFCDVCWNWYHVRCEQLEIQHQKTFKELKLPYICRDCRSDEKGTFSYAKCLKRLYKGALQGIGILLQYVEREQLFMKEDLSYTSTRSPKYSFDVQAQALLRDYCPSQKKQAAKVTKDGNSLFSAVSLTLVGTEKLAVELRVRCCIEMVVYGSFYKWQEKHKDLSKCAPSYTESCLNCATPDEDSCVWTMSALSSVVRRSIKSIYPGVNGKMDMAVDILNTVFAPRYKVDEGENLKILWGSTKMLKDQAPGSWVPDAFVPLVEMSTVPLSPVVLSLTPSRVSGRVRKPTAKVLAITSPKIKNEIKVVVESTLTYSDDEGDTDFTMASDFTLEPAADEAFLEKYKPEKINLHWMDKYTHVAKGGKPLKGTAFLSVQGVFNELSTTDVCQSIPTGRKEDVFFVVDNSKNLRYKHRRNYFQDDCGRYNQRSGTTCKSFYLLSVNNMLQQLIKYKGKYCKESKRVPVSDSDSPRRGRGRPPSRKRPRVRTESKVTEWIPMDPQPEEDKIVVLHRYYSSLDVDPTYKRRISWFSNLPTRLQAAHKSFLVEYITKPVPGLMLPATRKTGLSSSSIPTHTDSHSDNGIVDEAETNEQVTDADTSTSSQAEDTEMEQATEDSTGDADKVARSEAVDEINSKESEETERQMTEVKGGQVTEGTGTQLGEEVPATGLEEMEVTESFKTSVQTTVVCESGSQT